MVWNLFKVSNKETSTNDVTTRRSDVFTVDFEQISQLFVLVFLLFTLSDITTEQSRDQE